MTEVIFRTDNIVLDQGVRFCLDQSMLQMDYDVDDAYPKFGLVHWCMFDRSNDDRIMRCV